jgi:glycosyltransferase involved in cell wall biosynthesis
VLRLDVAAERATLATLYRRATCFVMPSLVEPSAQAYVEAASYGLASVGTVTGGSAELIGDGGLTVDPHDDDALLAAMERLCDGDEAARMGARARLHSRLYRWPLVAARILTALEVPGFAEAALSGPGRRPEQPSAPTPSPPDGPLRP